MAADAMYDRKTPQQLRLGVSPNTLLFGDAIPTQQSLLAEIDRIPTATPPRTIRDYVDKLMDRKSRLIVAAVKSQ